MEKTIAIVGSVNVDSTLYVHSFPKEGETINSLSKATALGGKGFNQAIAAKRAGAKVTFFGSLGKDKEAEFIKEGAKRIGLDCRFDYFGLNTGSALIMVDGKAQNEIVVDAGSNSNPAPSFIDGLSSFDIIVLQNEIPMEVNAAVIRKYGKEKTIIYNPAPGKELDLSLLPGVTYLTPNEIELSIISKKENRDESISSLLGLGVKNLLVTLGKEGCILVNEYETVASPSFKVKAIDTVAAGDTFIGYFASCLAKGLPLRECLRKANAAAGLSVTKKGAEPSIPLLEEVESFLLENND